MRVEKLTPRTGSASHDAVVRDLAASPAVGSVAVTAGRSKAPDLEGVFSRALGIPLVEVVDTLEYSVDARWDSVAHMALVAAIDESYDIMLETDDLLDMSSVAKAREILAKYGIDLA